MGDNGTQQEQERVSMRIKEIPASSLCYESEFSIPADDELFSFKPQKTVEETFDFDRFKEYVNLNCLEPQVDDFDPATTPFVSLRKKMIPVTEDCGVMKRIVKEGTSQIFPEGLVDIHYNSYLEMVEIPFDSSYLRQETPIQLRLNECQTYLGFQFALESMSVGEKSDFLIEPKYAFGEIGVPPRIPPNATILVQIEVFKSRPVKTEDEKEEMDDLHKFEVAYEMAISATLAAKNLYSRQDYRGAVFEYRTAVKLIQGASLTSDEEEKQFKELLRKTYVNLMTCYNRLGMSKSVCVAAQSLKDATGEGDETPKFFYQLAKAQLELTNFQKAFEYASKAYSLQPKDPVIRALREKIKEQQRRHKLDEKIMYGKALGLDVADLLTNKDANMTKEDVNQFRESAEQLISSSLTSGQPLIRQGVTDREWEIVKEVCHKKGVKLVEEFISGHKKYRLVNGKVGAVTRRLT